MQELYDNGVDTNFAYFKSMKQIFTSRGIDQMFYEKISMQKFKEFVRHNHGCNFMKDIEKSSSLHTYGTVKSDTMHSAYLWSRAPFKSIVLKFKLRAGVLGLGADLYRQKRSEGYCTHCNMFESAWHFVMQCSAYNTPRQAMYVSIKDTVNPECFNMFLQHPQLLFLQLLGDHDSTMNTLFLNFLYSAWRIRNELL